MELPSLLTVACSNSMLTNTDHSFDAARVHTELMADT